MRHAGRVAALQLLYQIDTAERFDDGEALLALYFQSFGEELAPEARVFAERLARDVLARRVELDELVERASNNWRVVRMSRVDRNVLRLATAELTGAEGTPRAVVLDEAVELAKEFGAAESGGFVNGVLNRLAQDLERGR